ncbi:DUF2167 domain-containing protein [Mesorhizobium plurifarium]|uniref:DUF2167 domain-containing protein n=1 Tax=Sinorhizobium arboris TaxID=76745 RepID=UPI000427A20D|nr:DUF2167 domain-containing protein [Sinorhizobium arboris]PST25271.1 DUF2167 domain-containing protein [Mesorhizobium plurifarium]
MKRFVLVFYIFTIFAASSQAKTYREVFGGPSNLLPEYASIVESLDFKQGPVTLAGANAKLNVPDDFYFLGPADTRKVLVDLWGNPPHSAEGYLGMIFPTRYAPESEGAWGSVIDYLNDGYVSDSDALTTDFDELLSQLKAATAEANTEREKRGYDPITLVGWASPPHYDLATHTMHWARDLVFGKDFSAPHTLNYSIRILGREGVLQMNFVAGLDQLEEIKAGLPSVTEMVRFDAGKAYADFQEGDKVAAYGMAGLIAAGAGAKIAAKAGLLALALAFLKKGGFLIVLAGAAIAQFLRGLLGRKTPPAA